MAKNSNHSKSRSKKLKIVVAHSRTLRHLNQQPVTTFSEPIGIRQGEPPGECAEQTRNAISQEIPPPGSFFGFHTQC